MTTFKTFIAHSMDDDCVDSLETALENQIQSFLDSHPGYAEVARSAPAISSSPHGEYNSCAYVFLAVTCKFEFTA